jgi:hypothetical protein
MAETDDGDADVVRKSQPKSKPTTPMIQLKSFRMKAAPARDLQSDEVSIKENIIFDIYFSQMQAITMRIKLE